MFSLRQKNFEKWILTEGSWRTFKGGSSTYCPIAVYVKEKTKNETVSVGACYLNIDYNNKRLPVWAQRFVRKFDSKCKFSTKTGAQLVLEVLKDLDDAQTEIKRIMKENKAKNEKGEYNV